MSRSGAWNSSVSPEARSSAGIAVAAFLAGRLPFLGIAEVVGDALARATGSPARDVEDLLEADREARRLAEQGLPVA